MSDDRWWTRICPLHRLDVGRGVAALVGGEQVALFLLPDGEVRAVGHHDPFSGANVIARGLTGDHGGTPTVASPIHKHRFDLLTGRCLDDERVALPTYDTRIDEGWIEVAARPVVRPASATVLEPHTAAETVG
jgi:nitrite reductase (NADH) small subunit